MFQVGDQLGMLRYLCSSKAPENMGVVISWTLAAIRHQISCSSDSQNHHRVGSLNVQPTSNHSHGAGRKSALSLLVVSCRLGWKSWPLEMFGPDQDSRSSPGTPVSGHVRAHQRNSAAKRRVLMFDCCCCRCCFDRSWKLACCYSLRTIHVSFADI